MSYGEPSKSSVISNGALGEIREEAVSAQRLVVNRLLKKYTEGAMKRATPEHGRKMINQKMFRLNKLIEWTEGNPDVVVDALSAGRLRCRLNASMGLGKSTLLASYVAKALDYRVLHISLDAHALQQVATRVHDTAIGVISRRWSDKKKAHVCCMTYDDFVGHMATSKRTDLFRCFELLIFDEGFVKNEAAVEVAGFLFSEYALQDTNLILCSGTLRKDESTEEMGSKSVGSFRHVSQEITVEQAISSGKLVTDYLTDRSFVIVPTNENINALASHYLDNGVDTKVLDDAADYEALREVNAWLAGDSTVPRVVVVHWRYYIAFNFPVEYGVIWPQYEAIVCDGFVCRSVVLPMSDSMVRQAMARTGRGIVDGSGGVIMSPKRGTDDELIETERMRAFVMLCAAAVKPLRTPFWEKCYRLFPDALPVATAMNILKIALPVEIAVRYLGRDGRVAARFVRAVNTYAQPDHYLTASDDDYPIGYDSWQEYEHVLDEQMDVTETFKLPFDCEGELQVILVAIELMCQDRIKVDRWRPKRALAFNDGYDSDEESRDSRFSKPRVALRRIEDRPLPPIPTVETIRAIPWEYRSEESNSAPRIGGFINSDRCRQALVELERMLIGYQVPIPAVTEVIEEDGGSVTPVHADGYGSVESPGGSVVCSLPVKICEKMNLGQELTSKEFLKLATAARADVDRFVASKLFDAYAGPWQSILNSLLSDDVVQTVVKKGVASDMYSMVDKMRVRFNIELCSILANSHVFKKTFLKIFRRIPTADDVMREIKNGRFDRVAQTDGFIARVKYLKTLIDEVLLYAEKQSFFLPTYITNSQRSMPVHGTNRLGILGENVYSMPGAVQKAIKYRGETKGGGSFSKERADW